MTETLTGENRQGPRIEIVQDETEGTELAKNILYEECGRNTVLFLSGGKTPKPLYEALAKRVKKFTVGALAMVDERYPTDKDYRFSNEVMITETGLVWYVENNVTIFGKKASFYPILYPGLSREVTAREYNETVQALLKRFAKKVAVLGLGVDGHTAGIAPNRPDFKNPLFNPDRKDLLVSDFKDPKPMSPEGSPVPPNGFGERITLTPYGLSQMDLVLLLVFGEDKKPGLEAILRGGRVEEAPGRILTTGDMAKKTILITDQKV